MRYWILGLGLVIAGSILEQSCPPPDIDDADIAMSIAEFPATAAASDIERASAVAETFGMHSQLIQHAQQ